MCKEICKTCAYYRQHYTFDKQRIFRVYCGHCTLLKTKRKAPDAKACEYHIPADPDEAAFASKEYLSKTLLAYVLKLDLLPQILEASELSGVQENERKAETTPTK